ncbi:membrane protein [Labrys miyagiensis]|uniref:Membrane protein n=1 Tax=Labrys miyagiensis TaxID=346912 RepID=A0ABQ6CM17_9HYPH|nr:urate hydroxylase PuuD [Labrys miyagiensis]GLS19754.1 membrane protein [Labrys miyagiensis]
MLMTLYEWGSLLLRWTHVITGIAWIGSSFYFMHLDASIRRTPDIPEGKGGEAWEVHGGGFYQVRKYLVAPDFLPEELTWHKWQSYSTWLSGFCLLLWVYYAQSSLLLIDPSVRELSPLAAFCIGIGGLAIGWLFYDYLCKSPIGKDDTRLAAIGFAFVVFMAWFFQQMFSARGAFIHTGALMATMMSANVFFVIIPNQHKVIAALKAGQEPDPALGKAAKQRSAHNNYLTLPVLFLMLSNHYPLTYSSPYAFVVVGAILIAGALIRVFYNERHAGRGDKWWTWVVAALLVWGAISLSAYSSPAFRDAFDLGALEAPKTTDTVLASTVPPQVSDVLTRRCTVCHATTPVWQGINTPPKGILLDTPTNVARNAHEVLIQAVMTHAMPPNNVTEMTMDERHVLRDWLLKGEGKTAGADGAVKVAVR